MNTPKTLNTFDVENVLKATAGLQNRKKVTKRNIVLKIETYERLEKHKIKLMSERENSRITFDDVINALLDRTSKNSVLYTPKGK